MVASEEGGDGTNTLSWAPGEHLSGDGSCQYSSYSCQYSSYSCQYSSYSCQFLMLHSR